MRLLESSCDQVAGQLGNTEARFGVANVQHARPRSPCSNPRRVTLRHSPPSAPRWQSLALQRFLHNSQQPVSSGAKSHGSWATQARSPVSARPCQTPGIKRMLLCKQDAAIYPSVGGDKANGHLRIGVCLRLFCFGFRILSRHVLQHTDELEKNQEKRTNTIYPMPYVPQLSMRTLPSHLIQPVNAEA